jgi:glycosyltransferase involved in cell wall biosynthesis
LIPDYSIIIPAYNEEALLPGTLARVREVMGEVAGFSGEVIVVDNNSDDGTRQVAESHGAKVVFEEKRQIAGARNAGAKASRGRFLVFLDADTLISRSLLEGALGALSSGEFCGGGALPAFVGEQPLLGRMLLGLWRGVSRVTRWAAGSYLFCLREAFLEVGGFDERFYASEELHLSRALKRWGKGRGQSMTILPEDILTSDRKLEWYSPGQALRVMLLFALVPSRLQRRETCWLWYERPKTSHSRS